MSGQRRKEIQSEASYEKALESLVRGAEKIEEMKKHPLSRPDDIAAELRKYDALADMIMDYQRRQGWLSGGRK